MTDQHREQPPAPAGTARQGDTDPQPRTDQRAAPAPPAPVVEEVEVSPEYRASFEETSQASPYAT